MIHFQDPIRVEAVLEVEMFQTVLSYIYPADLAYHKQQEAISQTHLDSLWVAQSGGMPIGRIAVYKNQQFCYQGLDTYCLGYYECANDDWVAAYLFKTLFRYLRSKKAGYVIGSLADTLFANGEYASKPDHYIRQWHSIGFEEMMACDPYMATLYPSVSLLSSTFLHTFFGKAL